MKIAIGSLVNDAYRFNTVIRKSSLKGQLYHLINAKSATIGINTLLSHIKEQEEDVDAIVIAHQDMHFRQGWIETVEEQLCYLPEDWITAGIIGKDMDGLMCGNLHDMRIVDHINTRHIHSFPVEACCFDECVIIFNAKKNFVFDEFLDGFDLYGTLAVLQSWEMGGTAWIIDAFAEHYCMRPFSWQPDEVFAKRYKMLYERYHEKFGVVDSTVFVERRFETSAGSKEEVEKFEDAAKRIGIK